MTVLEHFHECADLDSYGSYVEDELLKTGVRFEGALHKIIDECDISNIMIANGFVYFDFYPSTYGSGVQMSIGIDIDSNVEYRVFDIYQVVGRNGFVCRERFISAELLSPKLIDFLMLVIKYGKD